MTSQEVPKRKSVVAKEPTFDFEAHERERLEIARKYNVADPKTLVFEGGKWYKDGMLVEEWDELMSGPTNDAWEK